MQFSISPEVFTLFPDFKVGLLVVQGIDQSKVESAVVEKLLAQAVQHVQEKPWPSDRAQVWEDAFAKLGLNAKETKPAHLALLGRVHKNNAIPSILPLVDLMNSLSLQKGVPIGTHSIDNLSEDIVIRTTASEDTFLPMNESTPKAVEPGILAYTSGKHVLTKNLVWRQGETSKIRSNTKNVVIPIDTFENISEAELLSLIEEVKALVTEHLGGTVQTTILTKTTPNFSWEMDTKTSAIDSKLWEVLTRGVSEVLPSRDTLAQLMEKRKIKVYLGIDPTGSLLTLGHAVVLRKLQQFAELGHEVVLLIGNGTVRIGDPTGRDSTRPVLTDEVIEENFKNWKSQASKILDFNKITVVHNGDWLDKLTYADIVKLLAQTTVQQLIERDMFQDRLKNNLPIHGHEIIYPLLQGYDSVAMNVDLELGGTDQTFNMMMGRHLQKVYNNHEKWVLSTPIIVGTDGRKMSKSFGNFIALTEHPNDMYGKVMSTTDELIIEYFTLLTDTPMSDIERIKASLEKGENPMQFKKLLAYTITKMYHSADAAAQAQKHFEDTVQQKQVPTDLPIVKVRAAELPLIELLKQCQTGMSNSDLRRIVEQGGVELLPAEEKPTSPETVINVQHTEVIRIGKRRYYKISYEQ